MKLIDRYLFTGLMVPLFYCLSAFIMIFIIFDLFSHLSDFIEAGTPFLQIFRYYLYLIPSFIIYVVPISLLLAVLYSLSQLTRNNEITAIRACGVSLYRLMVPYIIVGFFASGAVWVMNESFAPRSAYWTEQFIRGEQHRDDDSAFIARNLAYRNPRENRNWFIGEFDTRTYDMRHIEVTELREDGTDKIKYTAPKGQWLDGRWWFTGVQIQKFDPQGNPLLPETSPHRTMTEFSETPREFVNVTKDPEFLSSRELLEFLDVHQDMSPDAVARIRVDLHYRLAMPWTCLIVTLLGLPIGSHTGRRGALLGVALALTLFFSYYVFINFGLALGKNQTLPPWLAAWFPNILFLGIGLVELYRLR